MKTIFEFSLELMNPFTCYDYEIEVILEVNESVFTQNKAIALLDYLNAEHADYAETYNPIEECMYIIASEVIKATVFGNRIVDALIDGNPLTDDLPVLDGSEGIKLISVEGSDFEPSQLKLIKKSKD